MLVVMICRSSRIRSPGFLPVRTILVISSWEHLILTMRTVEHPCISFAQMRRAMQSLK